MDLAEAVATIKAAVAKEMEAGVATNGAMAVVEIGAMMEATVISYSFYHCLFLRYSSVHIN